jgi:hypothetical protein
MSVIFARWPNGAGRAAERFQFVDAYNWDDGLDTIRDILASPDCSLETAVLAFWRAEGPWIYFEPSQADTEIGRLVHGLFRDILDAKYARAGIAYDPVSREGISRTQVYKMRKPGLPEIFFGPFDALESGQ